MISYNNSAPKAVNNVGQFGATEGSIGAYKSAAEYAADAKYWALLSQTKYSSVEGILAEVELLYTQGLLLKEDIEQLKTDFETQQQELLGLIQSTGTAIDSTNAATELSKEATQQVLAQLDIISNMTVQTTLLPPGSLATGSYDNSTGVFSFGIPEGQPGKDGKDGTDGTISDIGDVAISTPVSDDYGFFVDKDNGGLYRTTMSEIAKLVPAVVSFNGRTGPVVPAAGDYTVSQVTGAAASGVNNDINQIRGLTTALSVAQGGTGAKDAAGARANLGLGPLSTLSTVPIANGGTGSTTAAGARTNLNIDRFSQTTSETSIFTPNTNFYLSLNNNNQWGYWNRADNMWQPLGIGQGGTGATTADAARMSLVSAKSGDNYDITSLNNLTTALSVIQGGTGADTPDAAWLNIRPTGSTPLNADPINPLDAATKRWTENKLSNLALQEVARAVNVKDSEVILSTDTTQVLNGKRIIYDVVAQRIYGLPTLPTNVYINSVSNGQLTYSPGNITVTLLDSYQQYIGDGSQLSVLAAGSDTPRTLADRFADVVNVKDFGAVGDGITDDTSSIQAAINAANPFGKQVYVPAGHYKCKPLIAKQGFKLSGAGNRYGSARIDTNISLFLCDLADGEAFISYVGDGKWPEGEVEIDNLAFENLNSQGGTAGVVAANNRVFWAVADSADVSPARWIQKKEGGDNCPKSVFTRCTFSKFFIGIDIHSWMSRFEDLTSYSCGVLLRAYGTSNIVNRVWAVDPLWAGIQMKSTYSEVNACSFGEQPTNNAAAKGFELHGGYVVINGCGAEATIEDFIWAYNGSLIVNDSRPSTALPTKNFITIDAYATAMINGSYTPGSFSNSFSRAKDIYALDGITINPAPRCTNTGSLPFTESAFNASSGYYEGLCGTASKEASAIVLKTNNQNTNPKWSGESTLRSLPLLWEYSGTVRGSSILKSDLNFSVNGNFLNTDGGYQFDCRISKISNKGVILSSKLQDSGVLVSVYKKAGTWTHDYVYYGAAAGLTNDKGEQLIKAVFFQGDPLSTIRITIRDEVMTGKTEDELANSQVELIINASGDVPLLTGQNEAFTYSMRTTP